MTTTHDATDLTRSFIIEGAAGTGKSELAFQRYVTALATAQHPEEVLLMVDDERVMQRLRQRVSELLQQDADSALALQNVKLSWRLVEQPERLQIHTLGSLATALVIAAPVSSGCGAGSRLSTNPESYYRNAARALLRTLDHDERVAPNLETLLLHLDNDLVRAEVLLGGLLRRRAALQRCLKLGDPEFNRAALQSALEDAVEMTLSELSATLPADLAAELVAIVGLAGKQLAMRGSDSTITAWRNLRELPAADAAHLGPWHGLCELLLEPNGKLREEFSVEQGFENPDESDSDRERALRTELLSRIRIVVARLREMPSFTDRLASVRNLADIRYSHLQWTVLQSLLAVLPRVISDLSRAFSALQEMDLTEMVRGATLALQAGQAEIFGPQGLQHAVIDNAHDISLAGLSLVEQLTQSWTGQDERSVLIAGNAFASICRNDGAQPALFLTILNNGIGKCDLAMITLDAQTRSGSSIVNWINSRFSHETDAVIGEGGMPFIAGKATRDEPGKVIVDAVNGSLDEEGQAIVQLLQQQPELSTGTTAILLGDGSSAAAIIDALRGAGIPCHSEGVDLLGQRSVTRDLHALTRAICHLADRVAWLSVLRAPWCGLTLEDLHKLVADSNEVAVWDLIIDERRRSRLSDDGQQRLSRIKRVMAQTLAERGQRDLRRLVEGVWTALGGAVCMRSEFELKESRDFFRMLERIDDGGEPDSLEALDVAVSRLFANQDPADSSTQGSVLVTTIRHARRRSFETVIMAGLSTAIALPEDDDALRWLVRPDQFGKAQLLLAPVSGEGDGDDINRWVHSLQTRMHDNELRRLFYCGATRANDYLHVLLRLPFSEAGWGAPVQHSVLGAMYENLRNELPDKPAVTVQRPASGGVIRRLPSKWLLPPAPQSKVWESRETQAQKVDDSLQGLGDNARTVALVMQRTLGEIARQGAVEWTMRSLDGLESSLQQLLAMMGLPANEVADASDRTGLAIRSMLEDKRAQWLFGANESVHAPLRLTGWLDKKLVDADVDLSFIDGGARWLVYFAFHDLHENASPEMLDEWMERLRPACADAAGLVRGLRPMPVKIGVYAPYKQEWRQWDPDV